MQPPIKPLTFQGSTTAAPPTGDSACVGGRAINAYFSATGVSEGGDGNPEGLGFLTTDVADLMH